MISILKFSIVRFFVVSVYVKIDCLIQDYVFAILEFLIMTSLCYSNDNVIGKEYTCICVSYKVRLVSSRRTDIVAFFTRYKNIERGPEWLKVLDINWLEARSVPH